MQNKGLVMGVVVVAVLAVMAYFFFSSQSLPQDQVSTKSQKSITSTKVTSVSENIVREIVVEGDEFSFSPESLDLTKGEKVKLTFKNTGKFPHNFVIDELEVTTKTIAGGATDTIEFTAEKSGTFSFYCSVGNHRAQGMVGDLSVE